MVTTSVRSAPRWVWLAIAALAIGGVALYLALRKDSPAAVVSSSRIEFSDGSVAILGDGGEVETLVVTDRRVELKQVAGSVSYDVLKRSSRRFTVLVDDVRIEVVGTSFRVDKIEGGIRVIVSQGRVNVSRGDRSLMMTGGDEISWTTEIVELSAP